MYENSVKELKHSALDLWDKKPKQSTVCHKCEEKNKSRVKRRHNEKNEEKKICPDMNQYCNLV